MLLSWSCLSGKKAARQRRLGLECLEDRAVPASFQFDPDGPGPLAPMLIDSLDFFPGAALADNAVPANAGQTFQLYYQSNLSGVIDPTGVGSTPPGLNATFEITVVASLTEVVTSVAPGGAPATFQL